MDEAGHLVAKIQSSMVVPFMYKMVHTGTLPKFMQKKLDKTDGGKKELYNGFLNMFGIGKGGSPWITKQSIYNQFYSDLVTKVQHGIDVLWDTAKYIRRMKQRMKEHPHTCRLESVIYEHGTHFVFPESMLKTMLPVGSGLFVKLAFQAARKHPQECRSARLDIDHRVRNVVAEWKSAERDG